MTLRLALTPGEPAGIGPDLVIEVAQTASSAQLVAIADPDLLQQRAQQLGKPLRLLSYRSGAEPQPAAAGELHVLPVRLSGVCKAGQLNPDNADYVLETLRQATDGCLQGRFDALVTAPVHKGVINDAGVRFSGHTEFLAQRCGVEQVVMMLATEGLRVALATTHLPLREVADAIDSNLLRRVISILHHDLQTHFGIGEPHILVAGLNPHAGEGGHMGREEIEIIEPLLAELRQRGMNLSGPLAADTLFTPKLLNHADAVLAMYHDQGLPVLKYRGFGQAVNVTLGLPMIRTSVDHGTALELAGSGQADSGSLRTAINYACDMVEASRQ